MNPSKYIIYGLIDPKSGQLRYVGKSSSGLKRPRAHFSKSTMKADNATHKGRWIAKLAEDGLVPEIEILEEFDEGSGLAEAEQFWIAYFKFVGCSLTNLTRGGEGSVGFKQSPEVVEKRIAPLRGLKKSDEARRRMSESQRGRVISLEARRKISRTLTGRSPSDETRRKMSISRKGKKLGPPSDEFRIARSRQYGGRPFVDSCGRVYQTVMEAEEALSLHKANVLAVLKGRRKTAGGYTFRYVEEAA